MRRHAGHQIAALLPCVLLLLASPLADAGDPLLPDLVIGREALRRTLVISQQNVSPGDCTLVEGCVGGIGTRKTLEFETEIVNQGTADLVLGDPRDHPELFEFSPCHGHYHMKEAIHYTLSHGGDDTVSLYDDAQGVFRIRNVNATIATEDVFALAPAGRGLLPIAGDWDADGTSTAGLYDPKTGRFRLTNAGHPSTAQAEIQFVWRPAKAPLLPVTGDWDGDGKDTIGLYQPATGRFYLRSANSPGAALIVPVGQPNSAWLPIAGDWDGNDDDGVGLYDPASGAFTLVSLSRRARPQPFVFGPLGMRPIVGDWDKDGIDTIGLHDPTTGATLLRNSNSTGDPDVSFTPAEPERSRPLSATGTMRTAHLCRPRGSSKPSAGSTSGAYRETNRRNSTTATRIRASPPAGPTSTSGAWTASGSTSKACPAGTTSFASRSTRRSYSKSPTTRTTPSA